MGWAVCDRILESFSSSSSKGKMERWKPNREGRECMSVTTKNKGYLSLRKRNSSQEKFGCEDERKLY